MGTDISWWTTKADFRDKKAVIKLYREDKSFLTALHIPSVYWPLNGPYEVFHSGNTCCFEDDAKMVELFNSQEYLIGHCYSNTTRLANAFQDCGYDIRTYCGWAFTGEEVPVHHCWAVLTDEVGQKAVLDLSCDNYQMRLWFLEREKEDPFWVENSDPKDMVVAWISYALANLSHIQRCSPCGIIPPNYLYIGSPCRPEEGISIYQKLMRDNPGHL